MTTIASLPKELLLMVFSKIDQLAHLAECRLVCKAWTDTAEIAIFENNISFPTHTPKINSLLAFLRVDPAKTRLIKHLHFDFSLCWRENLIREVLQLVLTPNIETITGNIMDDYFVKVFMQVAESSPNSLGKLKTLWLDCSQGRSPPAKIALHCKESIQTMKVDYTLKDTINWDFINRWNEFSNLTSLTLRADIEKRREMDIIVDGCPHLRELSLETLFEFLGLDADEDIDEDEDDDDEDDDSIEDVDEGAEDLPQQPVIQHLNLKTLTLKDCSIIVFPDVLEYFLFKFANLQEISVGVSIYYDIKAAKIDKITGPLQSLEMVPQRRLTYTLDCHGTERVVLNALTETGYSIIVKLPDDAHYYTRVEVVL